MIRVEDVLGNLRRGFHAPPETPVDELWLTSWEAQRRRLRKRTVAGRDVAVALTGAAGLDDGDVLFAGPEATIVARVDAGEVVVFRLEGTGTPAALAANALRLGHVLGNQHWPLRLRLGLDTAGDTATMEIVVPLALDRRVVDAVIRAHRLEGVSYLFRPAAPGEASGAPTVPVPHVDDLAYSHDPAHGYSAGASHGPPHDHGHHPHPRSGTEPDP